MPAFHALHIDLQVPYNVKEFSYLEKEISFDFWNFNVTHVHT